MGSLTACSREGLGLGSITVTSRVAWMASGPKMAQNPPMTNSCPDVMVVKGMTSRKYSP